MESFAERFIKIANEIPDKTAIVCDDKKLSYHQLDILSSKIAARLIKKGAGKEKIYPIVLKRCIEYIASIIGILKAGAAYAPLSPDYPQDRIDYIMKSK